ncbi:MAG TPA: FtsX-like permease family protein [Microthrixaceae bacterium]|nr:FtsX-like permease family protein [Microthrixaceae bacterium]
MNPVWIVVGIAVLGLLITAVDLAASPTYRRLAVRSISRRRGEAMLIVVGAMFGTAIIGAALIVGDSFDGSIRDIARTELGPIDVRAQIHPDDDVRREVLQLEDRVAHSGIDHVDGFLPVVDAAAVLDNGRRGAGQRIDPTNCLLEMDFTQARRFGPDPISGIEAAGDTPAEGEAVMNRDVADVLGITAGDDLTVHLYGRSETLVVRTIVPTIGLAGYCGAIVAPGTIESMWTAGGGATTAGTARGPTGELFVSLEGGVFDSTRYSERAERQIRAAVKAGGFTDANVDPVKANRLESAERNGSQLRTIFSGIGGFSVISGILLLVNLVIMLAEERKVEFGLLRAVGFKRAALLRSFSLEGSLYALSAAVLGAIVGVGVGALVIEGTQKIFAEPNSTFRIDLFVHARTLLLAAGLGYAISIVTIWLASARVSRLNIISSIRDLPAPRRSGRHLGRISLAGLGVVAGSIATVVGVRAGSQIPLMAGIPVASFSAIGVVTQMNFHSQRPVRVASVVGPIAAIAWTLGVFTLFSTQMEHAGIAVFVVMGLLLVAAAVIIAVAFAPLWGHAAAARGGSFALSCRLGFAYPLARSVRTGLILAMFSLVIFTMVFMASLAATIDGQASSAAGDLDAGYDIVVDTNPSNPVSETDLGGRPGVAAVTTFTQSGPLFTNRYQREPTRWLVSGFDEGMLRFRPPALSKRLDRFADDRSVFDAVLDDPTLIVVDDQFLLRGGGPKDDGPEPGDRVEMTNPAGDRRTVTVAGVLKTDAIFQGSLWPKTAVAEFMAPATSETRAFLAAAPGSTPSRLAAIARDLQAATVTQGTDVSTFTQIVADELGRTTSFMRLLEVYLGFGLLIGIAGLGVVMVRAARERRHEIGTLRAMGLQGRVVSRAFLIEAFFIAGGGVIIGTSLALVTAYQVVVNSSAFSIAAGSFVVPWVPLVLIAIVPTGFALLAAGQPARAVGRIRPAVALRIAD